MQGRSINMGGQQRLSERCCGHSAATVFQIDGRRETLEAGIRVHATMTVQGRKLGSEGGVV